MVRTYKEIYNGLAERIYQDNISRKNIGKKLLSISISSLEKLSKNVSGDERIQKRQY